MYQLRFQGNKITRIYTELDICFKELVWIFVLRNWYMQL